MKSSIVRFSAKGFVNATILTLKIEKNDSIQQLEQFIKYIEEPKRLELSISGVSVDREEKKEGVGRLNEVRIIISHAPDAKKD